ncbi:MAG TPA: hypothetical protein VET27_14025, partial [Mycobacterium sp.]|nr:hypothetical protein [Mycobacterium sp.]
PVSHAFPVVSNNGVARGHEMERRGSLSSSATPLDIVAAMLVLERLPVPVLAVGHDGTILIANGAFAALVDHP